MESDSPMGSDALSSEPVRRTSEPVSPATELTDLALKEKRRACYELASKQGGISQGEYKALREEFEQKVAVEAAQ
jgi:hypothetical protein